MTHENNNKGEQHGLVNQQRNDAGLRELALFAGAGGGILGGHLLGWRTVCAVEYNAYARSVLLARQNDGTLPPFPVWDDVCTFDGKPWHGLVDVVSGGFPCQDISTAGKGAGISGERSGLWGEMARIVGEVRPRRVYVENSPVLTSRGLGRVLGDLSELGYGAVWGVVAASDVGAPHQRKRIWILADLDQEGLQERFMQPGIQAIEGFNDDGEDSPVGKWRAVGRNLVRGVHGVAHRVDRVSALGNGQVPRVAAAAWRVLA